MFHNVKSENWLIEQGIGDRMKRRVRVVNGDQP